jgi:hypothetical protein
MATLQVTHPGETYGRTFTFRDEVNAVYDPTTLAVTIKDSLGATAATKTLVDLLKTSTGVYKLLFNLAADAPTGTWEIQVYATYTVNSLQSKETFTFQVEADAVPVGYCIPSDVRLLIASDLTDAQLTALIATADTDLTDMLSGASMTPGLKRNCSMRLTAIVAAQFGKSVTDEIGGPSSSQGGSIAEWKAYVDEKVYGEIQGKKRVGKVVVHQHCTGEYVWATNLI